MGASISVVPLRHPTLGGRRHPRPRRSHLHLHRDRHVDLACTQRLLDPVPSVPTPVWGHDELHAGGLSNSNSVTSSLLTR